jgi:zinc/manganese transport system substrate-binding protein
VIAVLTRRYIVAAPFAAMLLSTPALAQEKRKVIASFSIIADLVKNVGGERIEVVSLVGPNGDGHVYNPTPADAKKVAEAKAVFVNGLGYEGWIGRLVRASGTKAATVVVSKGIKPREQTGAQAGHDHGRIDPHAWQSVANVKLYVANVRDALIAADAAGKSAYEANAAAYHAKLDALEADVKLAIARIPADRRRVVTTHNAFGYFTEAYGVQFFAPQGVSTEAEASARDVARLITQIKQRNISGVFLENITDPRLIERIAKETGAKVGGVLYSDALTDEKGAAPTYIDLIRHNIKTLGAALAN